MVAFIKILLLTEKIKISPSTQPWGFLPLQEHFTDMKKKTGDRFVSSSRPAFVDLICWFRHTFAVWAVFQASRVSMLNSCDLNIQTDFLTSGKRSKEGPDSDHPANFLWKAPLVTKHKTHSDNKQVVFCFYLIHLFGLSLQPLIDLLSSPQLAVDLCTCQTFRCSQLETCLNGCSLTCVDKSTPSMMLSWAETTHVDPSVTGPPACWCMEKGFKQRLYAVCL